MPFLDYRINPFTSAEIPEPSLQREWRIPKSHHPLYSIGQNYYYIELLEAPKNSGISTVYRWRGASFTTLTYTSSAPIGNQYFIDYVNGSNKLFFDSNIFQLGDMVEVQYLGCGMNSTTEIIRRISDNNFPVGAIIPSLYFTQLSDTTSPQAGIDFDKWKVCNGQAVGRGFWTTSYPTGNVEDVLSYNVCNYVTTLDTSNDEIGIGGNSKGNFSLGSALGSNTVSQFLKHGQPVKFNFTYGGITSGTTYYIYETGGNKKLTTTAPDSISGWASPPSIVDITGSVVGATYQVYHAMFGLGDGSTTYNLPDLRGVFLRGAGKNGTLTKANGGYYDGGVIGSIINDRFQGFDMYVYREQTPGASVGAAGTTGLASGTVDTSEIYGRARNFISDGTNGTPRTGDETNPISASISYLIKVA